MSSVKGNIRLLLRLEGFAVLASAVITYQFHGFSWTTFAWMFLIPDIAFAGYLFGPRAGAISYNASHSYLGALIAATAGFYFACAGLQVIGLVWLAHIGFDRMLGYGLKYSDGFSHTHLGRIGRGKGGSD